MSHQKDSWGVAFVVGFFVAIGGSLTLSVLDIAFSGLGLLIQTLIFLGCFLFVFAKDNFRSGHASIFFSVLLSFVYYLWDMKFTNSWNFFSGLLLLALMTKISYIGVHQRLLFTEIRRTRIISNIVLGLCTFTLFSYFNYPYQYIYLITIGSYAMFALSSIRVNDLFVWLLLSSGIFIMNIETATGSNGSSHLFVTFEFIIAALMLCKILWGQVIRMDKYA
ncbi:hypothetical protein L4D20_20685 [Vibrio kyushuensis]|uniref:hypothetical protein n=1 Tax=Vibrio kyushuensis TaxID=2910249 RepID=UPI003D0E7CAE